ncbi:AAA family ATPase [Prodigiosinella aquatilis]|nr:AAA family ATPase [Prodigiosinella sp. LS101]WJV53241.1 AAA family ATPase [Prodigiosinella sp. LS101]WJV57602.1 AAA family ATPase [Pectobacteriaceae bacterium C111]
MKIKSFRVRNYRSIYNDIKIDNINGTAIVGQNNSGKTNILNALLIFFNGKKDSNLYDYKKDFPSGTSGGQTTMAVSFEFDDDEFIPSGAKSINEVIPNTELGGFVIPETSYGSLSDEEEDEDEDENEVLMHPKEDKGPPKRGNKRKQNMYDIYLDIHEMLEDSRTIKPQKEFTVYLTISNKNNFSYSLFKGYRRKKEATSAKYTSKERNFIDKIFKKFDCIYVPSSKSIDEMYISLLGPYLRNEIAKTISPHINLIETRLNEISSKINENMTACGINGYEIKFNIPNMDNLGDIFSKVNMSINDNVDSDLNRKGMGIQCLSLFSSFGLLSQENKQKGIETIWLIEEPESYLHPSLSRSCHEVLVSLSKNSFILITTHSLSFISNDINKVLEIEKKGPISIAKKHTKISDAVSSIRNNLGVKFSDFFNFSRFNIFVEGVTDKDYLSWFLSEISKHDGFGDGKWDELKGATITEFGGIRALVGFVLSNYKIINNEVACAILADGDETGKEEMARLRSKLTNKVQVRFEANRDYVSVRTGFAIEGLFPDSWINECYGDHKSWFDDYSIDAQGSLEQFSIRDEHKKSFFKLMTNHQYKNHTEWSDKWINVANALNNILIDKSSKI